MVCYSREHTGPCRRSAGSWPTRFSNLCVIPILVSILALAGAVLVHGQPGFLSIDCGVAEDLNYTDDNTKIFYTSDTKFIDTGTKKEIAAAYMTQTLPRQYHNLRIFPDGTRNCYTLTPVMKSNRYLLRASFMYGNYDGLDQPPQFDAYAGVNRWEIYLPYNSSSHVWNEFIMVASLDYISVCLVNTGNGTPYISALELRPLKNLAYLAANESQSLRLLYRNHFRQTASGTPIRYPDDAYDRIWTVWVRDDWTPINNSSPVNLWSDDYHYRLPLPVINTAVIPSDPNNNVTFYFPTNGDPKLQYHVYMHFAELQKLKSNQSREFNIIVDGNLFYGPLSPKYLSRNTIFSTSPLSGTKIHSVVISKTTSSTLPPIFNAEEIFVLEPLSRIPTDSRDVDAIMNIKAVYQIKRNWMGDPCVPSNYSWEGLNCSYPDSKPPTIISLDLSSSGLAGVLAPSLANLTSILSLDVSNNSLTGPVPEFLAELPSLKILKLTKNHFTGSIPAILLEKLKDGSLSLSFDNNANVSGPFDISHCEAGSCKKRQRKIVVPTLASSISALVMLIIMGFVLWKFTQRRRQKGPVVKDKAGGSVNKMQCKQNSSLHSENHRFTYNEVVNMTNNFERPIGNGGFGTVYHGQMREGTQVAVKMFSLQSVKLLSHPRQGSNEFQNEAQLLMRVHHKNVVPFIGYCQEGDKMALIYENMALGNLRSHLSGTNNNSIALNWGQRLCIASDVALGLEYLHTGCRPPIIHRDMKTTNILLNERLEAKIGDFGMSKGFLQDDEFTHVSTAVKGTAGYLDPEYFNSNNLTHKSDVYSFGVVLLELITGRPAIIRNADYEKRNLVDWACPIIAGGDVQSVVDPRLEGDYDINSLWKVAEIVLACTSPRSIERPTMTEVVAELKDCLGTETTTERIRSLNNDQVEKTSSSVVQPSPR